MNLYHRLRCKSQRWAKTTEQRLLPWALADLVLGDYTLEVGPGYGANLRVLAGMTPSLTAIELDPPMARRLDRLYGDRARIIHGDGTATNLPGAAFSSVVCFTMLHHIPTPTLQDRLFAEAFRVLQPGGVFAGTDGVASPSFRLKHIGDTYNPVPPDALPERLCGIGFRDVRVDVRDGTQRWREMKPRVAESSM